MFRVQQCLLTWMSSALMWSPFSELMYSRQRSQHIAPVSATLLAVSPSLLLKKSDRGIAVIGMRTALNLQLAAANFFNAPVSMLHPDDLFQICTVYTRV